MTDQELAKLDIDHVIVEMATGQEYVVNEVYEKSANGRPRVWFLNSKDGSIRATMRYDRDLLDDFVLTPTP